MKELTKIKRQISINNELIEDIKKTVSKLKFKR